MFLCKAIYKHILILNCLVSQSDALNKMQQAMFYQRCSCWLSNASFKYSLKNDENKMIIMRADNQPTVTF